MYAHQILDYCISHGQRALDLLGAIPIIGHLKGELSLSTQAISSLRRILIQDRDGVIIPVKLANDMEAVLFLVKILVELEDVRPVNVEPIEIMLV